MEISAASSHQINHTNEQATLSPESAMILARLPYELILQIFDSVLDGNDSSRTIKFYWAAKGVCHLRAKAIEEEELQKSSEEELANHFIFKNELLFPPSNEASEYAFFSQPIFTRHIPFDLPDEFINDKSKLQPRLFSLFQTYLGTQTPFPNPTYEKLKFTQKADMNTIEEAYVNHELNKALSLLISEENFPIDGLFAYKLNGVILKRLKGYSFHQAAFKGNIDGLNSLPRDLSKLDINGFEELTPLHLAAANGQTEAVHQLLQFDYPSLNSIRTKSGDTALHLAVREEHLGCVKELLKHDPSHVSIPNTIGRTPLHLAALNEESHILEVLLQTNLSSASIPDSYGRTVLHYLVAQQNHLEVIKFLIQTNPSLAVIHSLSGNTALHEAASKGNLDAVKELLWVNPSLIFIQDGVGHTPLHAAASRGNLDAVKFLLQTEPSLASIKGIAGNVVFDSLDSDVIESLCAEISGLKHFYESWASSNRKKLESHKVIQ